MPLAKTATARKARPPLLRDVRFLRVVAQAAFVLALILVFREIFLNLQFGLDRQGLDLEFEFLRQRAGFDLKEGISFNPNQNYIRAIQVGIVNTIRAAGVGIALASLLGLVLGVARLSPNWLVRKMAQVYVEIFRNTPLAVQIFFWYFGVVLLLPAIDGGLSLGDVAFLSNRGAAIPWPRSREGAGIWMLFLVAGVVAALAVRWWRTRVSERTGRPHRRFLWEAATFLALAAAGYAVAGTPIGVDIPEATGRGYERGFELSPEFAALLIGLVVYTGAFIAEIIRGSILAVEKGQKEAAQALGMTPRQQLRLVVLPQAMRIALPPLNSQYLNLTKNTSLAVLIGYPDLVFVSRTIANQAGRATQVLLVALGTYLVLSLSISLVMNLINRSVTRKGRRR
jgi:general L-amino acid transport system permease protein